MRRFFLVHVLFTGTLFGSPDSAVVTGDSVRVRSEADTDARIVTVLNKGDAVTITERSENKTIAGITAPWVRIEYRGCPARSGWIFGAYLATDLPSAMELFEEAKSLEVNSPELAVNRYRSLIQKYPAAMYSHGCHGNTTIKAEAEIRIGIASCRMESRQGLPSLAELRSRFNVALKERRNELLASLLDCSVSHTTGPLSLENAPDASAAQILKAVGAKEVIYDRISVKAPNTIVVPLKAAGGMQHIFYAGKTGSGFLIQAVCYFCTEMP